MNEIDKKILSILQANADIPIAELSKKVNLSTTRVGQELTNFTSRAISRKKWLLLIDSKLIFLLLLLFKSEQINTVWLGQNNL